MTRYDRTVRRRRHRVPPAGRPALGLRGVRLTLPVVVLATVLGATACGALPKSGPDSAGGDRTAPRARPAPTTAPARPGPVASAPHDAPAAGAALGDLAGLGPRTAARIPAGARQVVVVTGQGRDSSRSHVVLYREAVSGWQGGASWPAHNALKGWTEDHRLDDLRSPIGVFTLSDAGGLRPDPGSKLPYTRSGGFVAQGVGFEGEPLAGSFDYVIAIDYNHVKGTSPLDWGRPLGADRGGGIWLHVDHGGPTHACVSLAEAHLKELLRTLDPARHPVIVMGDAASLAR